MISENQLKKILLVDDYLIKNNKTLFSNSLKNFINKIYISLKIPKESFIICLYYIYIYYNKNKDNNIIINDLFKNINIYILTCIIISLKQLFDENINIEQICNQLNINYKDIIKYELKILIDLDWKTSYLNDNFKNFKNYMEHYMNFHHNMDCLN